MTGDTVEQIKPMSFHWPKRMWAMARYKPKPTQVGVKSSEPAEPDLPTYKGAALDSWLSDRITETVDQQMQLFYQSHSPVIASGLLSALSSDPYLRIAVTKKLADAVRASGRPLTKRIYKTLRHVLEHSIHSSAHVASAAAHGFTHAFGHGAWASIAAGLTQSMSTILVHVLGKLILHHVSGQAFLHIIYGALHHVLIHSVLVGLAAAAAPFFLHMSVHSLMAVATVAAIPLVAAVALFHIAKFPERLAKEVAPKVRAAVEEVLKGQHDGNFRSNNRSALEMIVDDMFNDVSLEKIASQVLADEVEGVPFVERTLGAAREWASEQVEEDVEGGKVEIVQVGMGHAALKAWER